MKDYEAQDQVRALLMSSREAHGKTQKDMAKLLHISENTVYNWENGICNPSYINVKKWLDVLGYDISINDPSTTQEDFDFYRKEQIYKPPYDHISIQQSDDGYQLYYYFGDDHDEKEAKLIAALLEHYKILNSEINDEGSKT